MKNLEKPPQWIRKMSKILFQVDEFLQFLSYCHFLLWFLVYVFVTYFSVAMFIPSLTTNALKPDKKSGLAIISSKQKATFLMKPFNILKDNSLMFNSYQFSW